MQYNWEDVFKKENLDKNKLKIKYEEEGKNLSNSQEQFTQGWESTHNLTQQILSKYYNKSLKILDLGSGANPRLFLQFNGKKFTYISGDISFSKVKCAARIANKDNFHPITLDCEKIPLKDDSVDIVIFDDTVEHLLNPLLALQEICRVIKRDGLAIISTPNRLRPDVMVRKVFNSFGGGLGSNRAIILWPILILQNIIIRNLNDYLPKQVCVLKENIH